MATQAQQKEFINQIAPLIVKYAKKNGYKCASGAIAQACLESGYGLSSLAAKYHNYFGLKCGGSWKGASVNMRTMEEYTVGTLTAISDNFRAYKDMETGVAGYYDFIAYSRYKAVKNQTTPEAYLTAIKAAGYATSSTYVNNNMRVVMAHNLTAWDAVLNGTSDTAAAVAAAGAGQADPAVSFTAGKIYTSNVELNVRTDAGMWSRKKTHAELTANEKLNDKDKDGAIDKGTKVTCQEVKRDGSDVWIRIPSGWIAAYYQGNRYVA